MRPRSPDRDVDVTVITGLSGAGRSEAAKALEDLGWFVIDNLPPALIDKMLSLTMTGSGDIKRIAMVIDARGGGFFSEAATEIQKLREEVTNFTMVFLEAADDTLVRRFDASRRRHPLAEDDTVADGIQRERQLTRALRDQADLIINTSETSVRGLREKLAAYFAPTGAGEGLKTTVISFGYKFGLPLDADMVFDVRFLPNPHWVEGLREFTGGDRAVQDYVLDQDVTSDFLARTRDLLAVLLPGYQDEGRHYLTIGVGCTGGRHRSVVLAAELARFIEEKGFPVKVLHRDVERPPSP